jgi:hypothetical protein
MGSGCIDPHFLDLGTIWRWVVNFTPLPLYPRGKSPRYALDRRLGGPQSRYSIARRTVLVSCCKPIKSASAPCHVRGNKKCPALLPCCQFDFCSWQRRGMKQNIAMHFNSSLQCSQSVPSARGSHSLGYRGQWSRVRGQIEKSLPLFFSATIIHIQGNQNTGSVLSTFDYFST